MNWQDRRNLEKPRFDNLGPCDLIRAAVPIEYLASVFVLVEDYDGSLFDRHDGSTLWYYTAYWYDPKTRVHYYMDFSEPIDDEQLRKIALEFRTYIRKYI